MKTTKYFALAALTLALGACSDENEFYGDSKQITIEAGFGASSRVATNGLSSIFEADDAIGVYVWTGGTTLPDAATGYVANNVTNTYNGTKWTATPQMFWKDAETPHYFLAVYPQTDILTTTTYTLDATDQEKSDLLVATNFGKDNGGIVAQSNPVPLAFGHVMAKLRVNIKFNDEFTTAPTVEHVTVGAHATATIDWQTATATATGNATGIELPALATAAQGYACSYESVMVPQSGFKSVVMVIGGETYTFTSNQAMQLKKGTITTLNLTVGLSTIQAEDISILDWTTGASIDGYLNNISEQITAIKASLGDLEAMDKELNDYIAALQTNATELKNKIDAANTLIDKVKQEMGEEIDAVEQSLLTQLESLKTTLEGQLADVMDDMKTLKDKDAELEAKIAALQTYLNEELAKYGTKDWVNATFATLAQYEAVQTTLAGVNTTLAGINTAMTDLENRINAKIATDIQAAITALPDSQIATAVTELTSAYTAAIATAKGEIEAAYTAAIQTAIANLETSMKAWVNAELAAGYYMKAEIDAKLDALAADAAKYIDADELHDAIEAQKAALNTAISNLQTAYNAAIAAAIQDNNGVIDGKITTAIEAAEVEFQASIDTINGKITAIETRLAALEGDVAALKARIQSIRFIPEYSDGKVELTSYNAPVTLKFMVSPAAAAKAVAQAYADNNTVVTAFISRTKSRADAIVDPTAIHVTAVEGTEAGILTVTVNTENLPADYWADAEDANLFIRISDGNNDVISEMIPAFYREIVACYLPSGSTFYTAVNTFLTNNASLTKIKFIADPNWNPEGDQIEASGAYMVANENETTLEIRTDAEVFMFHADCKGMFLGKDGPNYTKLASIVSIDFNNCVNTSNVQSMENMFYYCKALTSLDLSNFDTSNVTTMQSMFLSCGKLETLDLSNFVTSKLTDMTKMFYSCIALTSLNLSSFDTSNVTDMKSMFNGCSSLASLDLSKFDTSSVTKMNNMFSSCSSLTSLNLSNFNTSNVTTMSNMFSNCKKLETLDLRSFTLDKIVEIGSMFYYVGSELTSGKTQIYVATGNPFDEYVSIDAEKAEFKEVSQNN